MKDHPPVEKPLVELEVGSALAQVDFSSFIHYHPHTIIRMILALKMWYL